LRGCQQNQMSSKQEARVHLCARALLLKYCRSDLAQPVFVFTSVNNSL
jgi:hypothetical protein